MNMQALREKMETKASAPAAKPKDGQGKMPMATVNFWLDAALFVNLVVIMWVSALLHMVFPAPTEAAGWTLWGLSYNDWHSVQFYALCVFALLAVEHLVLHWNWVCSVIATRIVRSSSRPDEGVQAAYGISTFIGTMILTMAILLAALATVRQPLH
jgi:hypothetical protein